MDNVDKLILLADKLDRQGLDSEAAFIDGMIMKKGYDKESQEQLELVSELISSYVARFKAVLSEFTQVNKTTGEVEQVVIPGESYPELGSLLDSIESGSANLSMLNAELREELEGQGIEVDGPPIGPGGIPPKGLIPTEEDLEEGFEEGSEEERWSNDWWDNRDLSQEGSEEEPDQVIQEEPDDAELTEETEGDLLSGDQRRTVSTGRGRVNVEQNLSNVGNITVE